MSEMTQAELEQRPGRKRKKSNLRKFIVVTETNLEKKTSNKYQFEADSKKEVTTVVWRVRRFTL